MSDAEFTRCPGCKAKLKVKGREVEGKKIRCPKCETVFAVQLISATSAAPKAAEADKPVPAPKKSAAVATSKAAEAPKPAAAAKKTAAAVPAKKAKAATAEPTVVFWQNGIGDDTKYHIAHVSPEGITLVLKMTDHSDWKALTEKAGESPSTAADLLQNQPKAVHLAADQLAKATHAEKLWQLTLFDREGRKTKVPEGKEQTALFAAIREHLGGEEGEEEADAWSVMQSPLFVLAVIGVIGGFMIYFTTICEPDYEATGRRSGMKMLLNTIGYKIGPFWASVAVGSLAAFVLFSMIYQLIKRPMRQVLEYPE